jgi:hypothetical protein
MPQWRTSHAVTRDGSGKSGDVLDPIWASAMWWPDVIRGGEIFCEDFIDSRHLPRLNACQIVTVVL